MTDGTFAVDNADKASGVACAELAALEYDNQQRRLLGDAVRVPIFVQPPLHNTAQAACNFPPHVTTDDIMGGRLLAAGLVPAVAAKEYEAFVARHGTVRCCTLYLNNWNTYWTGAKACSTRCSARGARQLRGCSRNPAGKRRGKRCSCEQCRRGC